MHDRDGDGKDSVSSDCAADDGNGMGLSVTYSVATVVGLYEGGKMGASERIEVTLPPTHAERAIGVDSGSIAGLP